MSDVKKTALEEAFAATLPDIPGINKHDKYMYVLAKSGWTAHQLAEKFGLTAFSVKVRLDFMKAIIAKSGFADEYQLERKRTQEENDRSSKLGAINGLMSAWSNEDISILFELFLGNSIRQQIEILKSAPPERLPVKELYSNRKDKQESPPDFITRVYGDWLTGEFTRADLRKHDEKAEMALRNWERTHGRAQINLPTLKERNDRILATAPPLEKPEVVKQYDRRRALIHKRQKNLS